MIIDFGQLPETLRVILQGVYDAELDACLPGFAEQLRKTPRAYECAIAYWFEHYVRDYLDRQEARQ